MGLLPKGGFHVWRAPHVGTPGYPRVAISMRGYPGVSPYGGYPRTVHRYLRQPAPAQKKFILYFFTLFKTSTHRIHIAFMTKLPF